MDEQAQPKTPTLPSAAEAQEAARLYRRSVLRACIDRAAPAAIRASWSRYVDVATANFGRKTLQRVVWPWSDREQTRTPRGKRRNPTSLP